MAAKVITESSGKTQEKPETNTPASVTQSNHSQNNNLPSLLSVKQLSELLHINEKKVYQLAAVGDIPCTKVTGKWLFPTQLVLDWIEQNSLGGTVEDRLVLSGADDLLLDRVCRRLSLDLGRSALLSYNPSGSMHGLRLLAARRTDGCFFHWGASQQSDRRHLGLLRSFREHSQWVVVRCLYRHEGLALSSNTAASLQDVNFDTQPHDVGSPPAPTPFAFTNSQQQSFRVLESLASRKLRWAQRHHESGTQRLLADICDQCNVDMNRLGKMSNYYAGERETAAAVMHDQADVALSSEAVAREYGLDFVRLETIAIDLVLPRKTFFRSIAQQLLKQLLHTSESIQSQWVNSYHLPQDHEVRIVKK